MTKDEQMEQLVETFAQSADPGRSFLGAALKAALRYSPKDKFYIVIRGVTQELEQALAAFRQRWEEIDP